jgi:pimeloyl-ACP methyl ester carboxylesterase
VVREQDCEDAEGFTCVTLRMPLDHFSDTGRTIDVTYAFKPRERRSGGKRPRKLGTFVTLTGGPGTSGIASAASYTDSFDMAIRERYDIVFLDQRGAHLSGDMTCPDAALAWYRTESDPATSTPTTGLGADAKAFVDACITESKVDRAILPYLGTRQAVEDLEAIREHLGADHLAIYGESYGTQYAQQYAAAHPDRVSRLILDGPVDLTHTLFDYYDEQTAAFDTALEGTLYDCTVGRGSTIDTAATNALAVWDELAAKLDRGPLTFEFHGSDGSSQTREFTSADLLNAGTAFLYSEYDRMLLQRAVAAASQGDLWYLSRLLYAGLVMDPDTQEAIPDPSYSDGLYYAVECLDYAIPGDTPDQRAQSYLDTGRALGMADRRLGDVFYGDLPCAFWPAQPESTERPQALTDVPYPMLVLGATLDPATPWANGERIAAAAGAQMIVKPGGPHVIYGRGETCPDRIVTDFLALGKAPRTTRTVCPGDVADDYVRLPVADSADYGGTLAALRDVDRETVTSVDYWYWEAEEPLETGCRFGGTVRYTPTDSGARLRFEDCSWSKGLAFSGTGRIDDGAGTLTMRLRETGNEEDLFRYRRDADGRSSMEGVDVDVGGGAP